jgi:serine/threonine protein kinase
MMREPPIQELRAARRLSQDALAVVLKTGQSSVSKLERRTGMYVSTLRSYIEAMGGELEITARFPDGAAHRQQVTHRDPRPVNVMIDFDGRPKILDFGLAKLGAIASPPSSGPSTGSGNLRRREGPPRHPSDSLRRSNPS